MDNPSKYQGGWKRKKKKKLSYRSFPSLVIDHIQFGETMSKLFDSGDSSKAETTSDFFSGTLSNHHDMLVQKLLEHFQRAVWHDNLVWGHLEEQQKKQWEAWGGLAELM